MWLYIKRIQQLANVHQKFNSPNMFYGRFHCPTLRKSTSQFVALKCYKTDRNLPLRSQLRIIPLNFKSDGLSPTTTAGILQAYLLPWKQEDIDNEDYDGLLKPCDVGWFVIPEVCCTLFTIRRTLLTHEVSGVPLLPYCSDKFWSCWYMALCFYMNPVFTRFDPESLR